MESLEHTYHYQQIAKAIDFILVNYQQRPSLEVIAAHVHLSPFHFQRLFQAWAGTTPKKFMQYISLSNAKELLHTAHSTMYVTHELGLSSCSRLHDLFVKIEAMTPFEYKNGGLNLTIFYSIQMSPFGYIIIASTAKGICYLSFIGTPQEGVSALKREFPQAKLIHQVETIHLAACKVFDKSFKQESPIHVHIKGTPFQLKVWEALLQIPFGDLYSYGDIAKHISCPKASRAVGSAIGHNPIAYLIPCHRVIQSSGIIGGYKWDPNRKKSIITWEISSKGKVDE